MKHNKKEAKSYLDFHLLVYLAKVLDTQTITNVIGSALNNKPISEIIVDLINSIPAK